MTELKQISFSLFKHIHNKLLAYCEKTGQNITAILRQAVYEFLNNTLDNTYPNWTPVDPWPFTNDKIICTDIDESTNVKTT